MDHLLLGSYTNHLHVPGSSPAKKLHRYHSLSDIFTVDPQLWFQTVSETIDLSTGHTDRTAGHSRKILTASLDPVGFFFQSGQTSRKVTG